MKFSTCTTYGLRAMINLAQNYNSGNVSLSSIALEEKISHKYLERIFAKLKKAGLIKSAKGARGGYKLLISPARINVHDIIKALEGKMTLFYCLSEDGKVYCGNKCECGATKVLLKVQQAVNNTLRNIKLSDLM
ncbi:Rrf2 family transcriptional regulator [Patescibacteria group bacterium]|nr:Rrf2 family transcriptional regulator [Candidatus Falkowbacteria bacterium]MBU3905892.1 Rrf2 family transcriptional regulator [Patescibacteria group bacterium]MCG2698572.1 Rrf2 family transcriptional regulator [Candidatus Parcubacteria bacterium]MBU4015422.1 Rrf2 family transcriptional regulator [Patescibacteria group bacterium]MBU4026683.1 Rrf2 family transcriptional regulator [Patescibacteria group bacterium]